MFSGIRLKNYKSLVDLKVNFLKKKNTPKEAIIVYGENGVGKSNFASAFYTLCESMQTLSVRKAIQTFLEKRENDVDFNEDIIKTISRNLRDTESIIRNCKTINSPGNMELEFSFILDNKAGNYLLVYDDTRIIHEKLEYVLNKNKCVFFDLTEEEKKINRKIFLNTEYVDEIAKSIEMYDGKHSLLSIILNEKEEKVENYLEDRINERLYEVIAFFMTMSIKVKNGNKGERGKMGLIHPILGELDEGVIEIDKISELDKAEELVNEFFTKTYSDIKQAYYKRDTIKEKIKYELFFKKKIYDKLVDVSYEMESTGTQHLLGILPFLLMCVEGTVVVIDELDTGIHDLLVDNILENIMDSIAGQLIITTHNTMILDSEISPSYIYSFVMDKDANKKLISIVDFEDRAHPYLSYRNRYLRGMYGGVPIIGDIDFDDLNDILK